MDETYPTFYSTLVVLPTGGGKTRVAVSYIYENVLNKKSNCNKVLWIAERLFLLEQAHEAFVKLGDKKHLPDRDEAEIICRHNYGKKVINHNSIYDFAKKYKTKIVKEDLASFELDKRLSNIIAMSVFQMLRFYCFAPPS